MSRSLSCDSQSKGSVSTPRGTTVNKTLLGTSIHFFFPFHDLILTRNNYRNVLISFSYRLFPLQKVDLSKLEMAALWRYWRHFNLVSVFLEGNLNN
jgi:hypothetical protein